MTWRAIWKAWRGGKTWRAICGSPCQEQGHGVEQLGGAARLEHHLGRVHEQRRLRQHVGVARGARAVAYDQALCRRHGVIQDGAGKGAQTCWGLGERGTGDVSMRCWRGGERALRGEDTMGLCPGCGSGRNDAARSQVAPVPESDRGVGTLVAKTQLLGFQAPRETGPVRVTHVDGERAGRVGTHRAATDRCGSRFRCASRRPRSAGRGAQRRSRWRPWRPNSPSFNFPRFI